MTDDNAPPEHIIQLKAAWFAADRLCKEISAETPAGETLSLPGGPDGPWQRRLFSPDQSARLDAAREERLRLTLEIARDPWRKNHPNRHAADVRLHELARERQPTLATAEVA